jgi:hypothetical protein
MSLAMTNLSLTPPSPPTSAGKGTASSALSDQLRSVRFDGASGQVAFNASTGDRAASGLELVVFAWCAVSHFANGSVAQIQRHPTAALALRHPFVTRTLDATVCAADQWPSADGTLRRTPIDLRLEHLEARARRLRAAHAADAESRRTLNIVLTVAGSLFALTLPYGVRKLIQRHRMVRKAVFEYENGLRAKLHKAIETTREFEHAEVLITLRDFGRLGSLKSHEELRDRGILLYHDVLSEMSRAPQHVIFYSHQWTSWTEPDPSNQQYRCMLAAADSICKVNHWRPERVWVWCECAPSFTARIRRLPTVCTRTHPSMPDVQHTAAILVAQLPVHPAEDALRATDRDQLACRVRIVCRRLCHRSTDRHARQHRQAVRCRQLQQAHVVIVAHARMHATASPLALPHAPEAVTASARACWRALAVERHICAAL